MRPLRLIPDDTAIPFMRGRYAGVATSAVLSIASLVLFVWPGLNYSIDFRGGVLIEARLPGPADLSAIRTTVGSLGFGDAAVQQFGQPSDVLIKLGADAATEAGRTKVQSALQGQFPGTELRRAEVVGSKVSGDLFRDGMTAAAMALGAMLLYIWFRFDWQFGVGLVSTLVLDVTKTIGFYGVTRLPFDLNSLAAILILIGFSVTDKVVVYDRIRENLRKFKTMPLRQVIDLSINQTLSRTVATSLTVLLSILPLALIGKGSVQDFAWTMVFGIVIGTTSSIFIASPILLFLGERRLRRQAGAEERPAVSHPIRLGLIAVTLLALAPAAKAACGATRTPPTGAGLASWYGAEQGGRRTASGERYDPKTLTAAHNSLAFGTLLRVTSVATGRSVTVRVNDRGPGHGRLIDLSEAAARRLGTRACGVAEVTIEQIARLD